MLIMIKILFIYYSDNAGEFTRRKAVGVERLVKLKN